MATAQTTDLINAILGAGGVGFLTMAYKGIKQYREGTWRRHDGAVADLEKWRKSADDARKHSDDDREWEAVQGRYWFQYSGDLEHVIRVDLGADHLPVKKPFPVRSTPAGNEATP